MQYVIPRTSQIKNLRNGERSAADKKRNNLRNGERSADDKKRNNLRNGEWSADDKQRNNLRNVVRRRLIKKKQLSIIT